MPHGNGDGESPTRNPSYLLGLPTLPNTSVAELLGKALQKHDAETAQLHREILQLRLELQSARQMCGSAIATVPDIGACEHISPLERALPLDAQEGYGSSPKSPSGLPPSPDRPTVRTRASLVRVAEREAPFDGDRSSVETSSEGPQEAPAARRDGREMTTTSVAFTVARGHSLATNDHETVADASAMSSDSPELGRSRRPKHNTQTLSISEIRDRAQTSDWDGESFAPMTTTRSMMSHAQSTRRRKSATRNPKAMRMVLRQQWAKVDLTNPQPRKDGKESLVFRVASMKQPGALRFGKSARVTLSLPSFQTLSSQGELEHTPRRQRRASKMQTQSALSLGSFVAPQQLGCVTTAHPHGFRRAIWDVLSCVLIAYDGITIPFEAFSFPEMAPLFRTMSWVSAMFWTLDICLSMTTGVYIDGELHMRYKTIWRKYLSSWFLLDLTLVTLEWYATANQAFVGVAGTTRATRITRIFRAARIARVAKMLPALRKLEDNIISKSIILFAKFILITIGLLFTTHITACIWYDIGNNYRDGWVRQVRGDEYSQLDFYVLSLHWSMSQFHGGFILEHHTTYEQAYTIGVQILAMIVLAVFISEVTNLLFQIQSLQSKQSQVQHSLHRFLESVQLSAPLRARLVRYIRSQGGVRHEKEQHAAFLARLPETLLIDVHAESYSPVVNGHPFFFSLLTNYPRCLVMLCHHVVQQQLAQEGEIVFQEGDQGLKMYFVADGTLDYLLFTYLFGVGDRWNSGGRRDSTQSIASTDSLPPKLTVHAKGYISEAVLWLEDWEHLGELTATCSTTLLTLERSAFGAHIFKQPGAQFHAASYAHVFVEHLANCAQWSDVLPTL